MVTAPALGAQESLAARELDEPEPSQIDASERMVGVSESVTFDSVEITLIIPEKDAYPELHALYVEVTTQPPAAYAYT